MQRLLPRILISALCVVLAATAGAQDTDTTGPTAVDPDLIAIESGRVPKEYTIRSIKTVGVQFLDTAIVQSISGIQVGDKVMLPGGDAFSKAIQNLWRQRLFSNVQIYITAVKGDQIDIEISIQERPKLGSFNFVGVKSQKPRSWKRKRA